MNARAKMNRTLGLMIFAMGSTLLGQAQVSEKAPASISQIEDELKQHPGSSKLHVALGLAFWDRNDNQHAFEAFQTAVKLGPTSAEAHNWLGVAILEKVISQVPRLNFVKPSRLTRNTRGLTQTWDRH